MEYSDREGRKSMSAEKIKEILIGLGGVLIDAANEAELLEHCHKEIETPTAWKTLDVNCLPEDILVGDYEMEINLVDSGESWGKSKEWKHNKISVLNYILNHGDCFKYRYRLKQTKKTDEELAEEYCVGDRYACMGRVTVDGGQIKDVQIKAFIAGRKSAQEGE